MKAFACILLALLCAGCAAPQEQASIGIIGGADGPTQIFVTQTQDSMLRGMVMPAMILVMSILGFYFLGHMRKK